MGRGKSNDFSISGPNNLTSIDWDNPIHRTVVAACLVNGVYTMQRDKAKKRASPLANPWWEFFGFFLVKPLINEADDSIYGAVFEYNNYDKYQKNPSYLGGIPPRHVIAFRGTVLSSKTGFSDLKQDIRCFFNTLNLGRRVKHAIQEIETVLPKHKSETTSVWLVGHSLGAGVALLAGKAMARAGVPLETYAFNPPHTGLPVDKLFPSDVLKRGFRLANSLCKATLGIMGLIVGHQIQPEDDPISAEWTPYLYVHPKDLICLEFIGDFNYKNFMAENGAGGIERALARIQFRSQWFGGGGGGGEETSSPPSAEPIYLLSSADMTVNMNETACCVTAHMLKQWYDPDPARRENWKFHSIRPFFK